MSWTWTRYARRNATVDAITFLFLIPCHFVFHLGSQFYDEEPPKMNVNASTFCFSVVARNLASMEGTNPALFFCCSLKFSTERGDQPYIFSFLSSLQFSMSLSLWLIKTLYMFRLSHSLIASSVGLAKITTKKV